MMAPEAEPTHSLVRSRLMSKVLRRCGGSRNSILLSTLEVLVFQTMMVSLPRALDAIKSLPATRMQSAHEEWEKRERESV